MMETNPIKKMANNILQNRKKASFDRSIMHPEREWFLSLMVGLVALGVGIYWSMSTYTKFSNVSVTDQASNNSSDIYRDGLVEAALIDFEVRKKTYEEIKTQLLDRYKKIEAVVILEAPDVKEEVASSTLEFLEVEIEETPIIPDTPNELEIKLE